MKLVGLVLVLVIAWTAGLLAFAARIERSTPPPMPAGADAIVAFTGPSTARIEAAMRLLEAGKGRRMLVSGVNRQVTRAELRTAAKAPTRLYDCCVDLGRSAANTVGNARETAVWARRHGFRRLILVTSDYHTPRSLLELRGALPEASFQIYPVATEELNSGGWWRNSGSARRMILEYSKYLVILTREAILCLGPRDASKKPREATARTGAKPREAAA